MPLLSRIRKIIFKLSAILLVLGILFWWFFPILYKYGHLYEPVNEQEYKFAFCKYTLPEYYSLKAFRDGGTQVVLFDKKNNKNILVYQRDDTGQFLILTQLREFPHVDLSKVTTQESDKFSYTLRRETRELTPGLNVIYLVPRIRREDIEKGDKLVLRPITVTDQKRFDTEVAEVLYFKGEFERVGFWKPSSNLIQRYAVPIFDFKQDMKGGVAIINEKKTGRTIFAIGAIRFYNSFNEEEFLNTVKSITFDAAPPKEMFEDYLTGKKKLEGGWKVEPF